MFVQTAFFINFLFQQRRWIQLENFANRPIFNSNLYSLDFRCIQSKHFFSFRKKSALETIKDKKFLYKHYYLLLISTQII